MSLVRRFESPQSAASELRPGHATGFAVTSFAFTRSAMRKRTIFSPWFKPLAFHTRAVNSMATQLAAGRAGPSADGEDAREGIRGPDGPLPGDGVDEAAHDPAGAESWMKFCSRISAASASDIIDTISARSSGEGRRSSLCTAAAAACWTSRSAARGALTTRRLTLKRPRVWTRRPAQPPQESARSRLPSDERTRPPECHSRELRPARRRSASSWTRRLSRRARPALDRRAGEPRAAFARARELHSFAPPHTAVRTTVSQRPYCDQFGLDLGRNP